MLDSDFDNRIKLALEEYEDATPVALGWEKFQALQAPATGVVGATRWLKTSVVINVLLLGMVTWLGWNFLDLKTRMTELETASPTGQQIVIDTAPPGSTVDSQTVKATESTLSANGDNQSAVPTATTRDSEAQRANTDKQSAPIAGVSMALADPLSSAASISGFSYLSRPLNGQLTGIAGPSQPPFNVFAGGQDITLVLAEKERKPTNLTMPLSTVVALEKTRMGNKIAWEYGASANYGYAWFGESFAGTNAGGGVIVEAIFHPLLGLEAGLAFQQYNFNTKNQSVALKKWERTTGVPSLEPIEHLSVRLQSLEIPLALKLRLPKSDRSYWFASVGVVQSMKLSKHQKYEVLRLEVEEYETEYEEVDLNFRDTKASPLFTGLAAELGVSKRLLQWNAQWQAGVYYKNSLLRNSQEAAKVNLVGVRAGIRF